MVRRAGALALGLAFILAAASAVHAIGTPAQEPLWAYGFDKAPAYDEPAAPAQNPPTRDLRTTESVDIQLRPRHLEGSAGTFKDLAALRGDRSSTRFRSTRVLLSVRAVH